MKAWLAGMMVVLWGGVAVPTALAQQPATVFAPAAADDLHGTLEGVRAKHRLPGLAAVVVRDGRIIAQGAAGVRAVGHEERATIDDLWHLGSCTKAMTATLCAMLVEEGALSWDTTVAQVFPELAKELAPGWEKVTLERLLTNTAGAPANLHKDGLWAALWKREGEPREQRMRMLRAVAAWPPDHEPGTAFKYSNTNFAVAGAMAERVTGVAFEDLMRERLFKPLGITSAGFGAPGTPGTIDQPRGTSAGKSVEPGPGADNPPAIAPAGTVHMSLPDWAKFAALHATGERADGLMKAGTVRRLHTPAMAGYAHGWGVTERPWAGPEGGDRRALTHSGSNTMWYCVAWVSPCKGAAVLVATNVGGDDAVKGCDAAAGALVGKYVAPIRGE